MREAKKMSKSTMAMRLMDIPNYLKETITMANAKKAIDVRVHTVEGVRDHDNR